MIQFDAKDLAIFEIPQFEKRMPMIKEKLRPKLEDLGETLVPLLMNPFKQEFYVHTAKHLRRKVNPPDETWVALGPQKRGYKAYVYFSFCIGKSGVSARVVMKDESDFRKKLGQNLLSNLNFFEKHAKDFKGLKNYLKRNDEAQPETIQDLKTSLSEIAQRLIKLKSASFDLGFALSEKSQNLVQDCVQAFDKLFPFYECGHREDLRLKA